MIPGLGQSPGERKGYPLQFSGLENSMDCIVHGVAKSWTQLSDLTELRISEIKECLIKLRFVFLIIKHIPSSSTEVLTSSLKDSSFLFFSIIVSRLVLTTKFLNGLLFTVKMFVAVV